MQITIYSTSICATCESLTRWLDKKNIKYIKKITDEDPLIMEEFTKINDGMVGVPFTVIKDGNTTEKVSGFDQRKFKKILGI